MWAIKILNGPQSGKIFPLQKGNNVLGRSPKADIRLVDQGVSKSHAQIFVTNDKVIVSDLKSNNGTFVNGIKVQNNGLKTGDKVLVNQTIFTIFQLPDNVVFADKKALPGRGAGNAQLPANQQIMVHQNLALQSMPQAHAHLPTPAEAHEPSLSLVTQPQGLQKLASRADTYIDEVALPPIYKSTEKLEFKYVLMLFTVVFIFLTTFLAIFPLSQLTKESVLNESKLRALTMARNLAQMNRKALADGSELSLTTDFISRETSVENAYIVSASSGAIMAPPSMMGQYIKDPFIISLRNSAQEKSERINDKQVGAAVPIRFYDADIGDTTVKAYAVVVYNLDPLVIDFNRTLSLFVQIFLIACIIGAIIYFVQYRVIIRPLHLLNREMDKALSKGSSDIQVPFRLGIFQDLVSNINSSLSRISSEFAGTDQMASTGDKTVEAAELVKMFPIPAFAVDPNTKRFITVNPALEGHPLFDAGRVLDMMIDELTDKSLYESLKDLMATCEANPNVMHSNILPSQGIESYEISAKAVISGNKTSYVIFTVMQIVEDEGGGG